jgi:hypothetical protein
MTQKFMVVCCRMVGRLQIVFVQLRGAKEDLSDKDTVSEILETGIQRRVKITFGAARF